MMEGLLLLQLMQRPASPGILVKKISMKSLRYLMPHVPFQVHFLLLKLQMVLIMTAGFPTQSRLTNALQMAMRKF